MKKGKSDWNAALFILIFSMPLMAQMDKTMQAMDDLETEMNFNQKNSPMLASG